MGNEGDYERNHDIFQASNFTYSKKKVEKSHDNHYISGIPISHTQKKTVETVPESTVLLACRSFEHVQPKIKAQDIMAP